MLVYVITVDSTNFNAKILAKLMDWLGIHSQYYIDSYGHSITKEVPLVVTQ